MGNGKCGVLHCSLWAVQTINLHTRNTERSNAPEINCSITWFYLTSAPLPRDAKAPSSVIIELQEVPRTFLHILVNH